MRCRLLLGYVGTRYSGWQIQDKPSPPPTIQGMMEAALRRLCGTAVRVHAAGRTDAGVHAYGQVVHCDVPDACRGVDWRYRCNALLPGDIRVLQADVVAGDFHARKDAVHKTYIYQFWQERAFLPPQLAPHVWHCGALDTAAMRAALAHLLGRHDFAGLRNAGTDVESTERTVLAAEIRSMPPCEYYPAHAPLLRLTITADGFLKQMVRNVAGLLVACGQGKLQPDLIPAMLALRDRRALPSVTAPARGLTLARVSYRWRDQQKASETSATPLGEHGKNSYDGSHLDGLGMRK